MALAKCPECGEYYEDILEKCPKCGKENSKPYDVSAKNSDTRFYEDIHQIAGDLRFIKI